MRLSIDENQDAPAEDLLTLNTLPRSLLRSVGMSYKVLWWWVAAGTVDANAYC